MDLKIKDVAELLHVSEKTIIKWLANKKIPSYKINHQYLFNRNEIEDWVIKQQENPSHLLLDKDHEFSNSDLDSTGIASGGIKQFSLYRALHKGKMLFNIPGNNKEEILRNASHEMASLLNLDSDVLGELLLERENLHSTSLGQGIALPHAREHLLTNYHDIVVIAFLEKLTEYGALDGIPVHTLIFLFACDDKRHLNLIAKIAHLAHIPETLHLLKAQPKKEILLNYIKNWEANPANLQKN